MRVTGLSSGEGLVGSYILNDSFGMRARDCSQYAHSGTLTRGCRWKEGVRPIEIPQMDEKAELATQTSPYLFDLMALEGSFVYCNGDSLVILYRRDSFSGLSDGVFQVFNIDSGQCVQETLHTHCGESLSAAFDPKCESYYVHQSTQ